jgi:hypothetical protein
VTNTIFEQVYLIIVMAIIGSSVSVIGLYLQSSAIVGLGVLIAGALPVTGIIFYLFE